jgi:hypothetical protein
LCALLAVRCAARSPAALITAAAPRLSDRAPHFVYRSLRPSADICLSPSRAASDSVSRLEALGSQNLREGSIHADSHHEGRP